MGKTTLRFDQLTVTGASRAGDSTWFRVQPPGLGFDVGRGALELTGAECLFLTHGHLDHSLGLPFVLSNRAMQELGTTRVFCPAETVEAVARFVEAAERLEKRSYDYTVHGLAAGERVEAGRGLAVEAFAVRHGVPALGYHLIRGVEKLRAEYVGRPGEELAKLRRQGVAISETDEQIWVSYCGDTAAGVFELEPRLFESRVLLLECTFLAAADREGAGEYGHLHLDDLVAHAGRFHNEALVLHHLTNREQPEDLRRAVADRLPELAGRVHFIF